MKQFYHLKQFYHMKQFYNLLVLSRIYLTDSFVLEIMTYVLKPYKLVVECVFFLFEEAVD